MVKTARTVSLPKSLGASTTTKLEMRDWMVSNSGINKSTKPREHYEPPLVLQEIRRNSHD